MISIISKRKRWTQKEEKYLRKCASVVSAKMIAVVLKRTYNALRVRAFSLGIRLTSRNQKPGKHHKFPCGCRGVLPKIRGKSNIFARATRNHRTRSWVCRVLGVLKGSQFEALKHGYKPIKTSHREIRKLMRRKRCCLCRGRLKWSFGRGKTPHLHHNHKTGEVYGFSHPSCNPQALQNEIERLKIKLDKLLKV